jgi:integrase
MPRTIKDAKLGTREARSKLPPRGNLYFREIEPGLSLGYRRIRGKPGTWWVRKYAGGLKYETQRLGIADDDPNIAGSLSFDAAQKAARERSGMDIKIAGPYTVDRAADDYLEYLRHEGRSDAAIRDATWRINSLIRPPLGRFAVSALTVEQLRKWLGNLAKTPPRRHTKAGEPQNYGQITSARARQSTANRVLTILKAILNHAYDEEKVASNKVWGRRLKPYRSVDAARPRHLTVEECKRLLNGCDQDFRQLVQAAMLTGGRYSQIAALKVSDFNAAVGTIDFRSRKGSRGKEKRYSCVLTDEGISFFKQVCIGRGGDDLIFTKASGEAWGTSHQTERIDDACKRATIKPPISFHGLRHTWASLAVMNATPLLIVARNLGHSDTRMVESHYGHLAPSYIADAIRAGAPRFNFKADKKIVALKGRA